MTVGCFRSQVDCELPPLVNIADLANLPTYGQRQRSIRWWRNQAWLHDVQPNFCRHEHYSRRLNIPGWAGEWASFIADSCSWLLGVGDGIDTLVAHIKSAPASQRVHIPMAKSNFLLLVLFGALLTGCSSLKTVIDYSGPSMRFLPFSLRICRHMGSSRQSLWMHSPAMEANSCKAPAHRTPVLALPSKTREA